MINHRPLVNNLNDASFFEPVFVIARKALVPDNNTNTGAQKLVIHLVRNIAVPAYWRFVGSYLKSLKKNRVWSKAIMSMTMPRKISIEWILLGADILEAVTYQI